MLSEPEREELLRLAKSASLRQDCEMLRQFERRRTQQLTPKEVLQFLTSFQHMLPAMPARPFPIYQQVKL